MISHHVTFHVNVVTCLFIIHKKEIQKKKSIKSKRIDKRKKKISPYIYYNSIYSIGKYQRLLDKFSYNIYETLDI